MGILTLIIVGLVAGLIARALMPGRQHLGLLATILLGIVGSFVGGLIGYAISGHNVGEFHRGGLILSIVGAFIVLMIWGAATRRRAVS